MFQYTYSATWHSESPILGNKCAPIPPPALLVWLTTFPCLHHRPSCLCHREPPALLPIPLRPIIDPRHPISDPTPDPANLPLFFYCYKLSKHIEWSNSVRAVCEYLNRFTFVMPNEHFCKPEDVTAPELGRKGCRINQTSRWNTFKAVYLAQINHCVVNRAFAWVDKDKTHSFCTNQITLFNVTGPWLFQPFLFLGVGVKVPRVSSRFYRYQYFRTDR